MKVFSDWLVRHVFGIVFAMGFCRMKIVGRKVVAWGVARCDANKTPLRDIPVQFHVLVTGTKGCVSAELDTVAPSIGAELKKYFDDQQRGSVWLEAFPTKQGDWSISLRHNLPSLEESVLRSNLRLLIGFFGAIYRQYWHGNCLEHGDLEFLRQWASEPHDLLTVDLAVSGAQ